MEGTVATNYHLYCEKHGVFVEVSTNGMTGPQLNCDITLAFFIDNHKGCKLIAMSEHELDCLDVEIREYTIGD